MDPLGLNPCQQCETEPLTGRIFGKPYVLPLFDPISNSFRFNYMFKLLGKPYELPT